MAEVMVGDAANSMFYVEFFKDWKDALMAVVSS